MRTRAMSRNGEGSSGSGSSSRISHSNSPSSSSNNEHGRYVLDERLRSVLCHRLGLPLLYALHGKDPNTLKYLGQKRQSCQPNEENRMNRIFKDAVGVWKKHSIKKEPEMTKILSDKIAAYKTSGRRITKKDKFLNALKKMKVEESGVPDGDIDIIFTAAESRVAQVVSTPLTVIEFGLNGNEWWKKLDQGVKYVDRMHETAQKLPCIQFKEPLLLAVVTYEDSWQEKECQFRIGVFLCSQNSRGFLRMALLWRRESTTLEDASKMFGRLLRVTADFRLWRDKQFQPDDGYKYFGPNCCKALRRDTNYVVVLRSYDSRVCVTNRSPDIYLDPDCRDIVGAVEKIVEMRCARSESFWVDSKEQTLLIIAVPFRQGFHVAKEPDDFIPIINQLTELHEKGFVHGDIRAFNTVFGGKEGPGSLIDFDFGGKLGSRYPKGYCQNLEDGRRIGRGEDEATNEILPWHDWHALGQLIFHIHRISSPSILAVEHYTMLDFWTDLGTMPTDDDKHKLKEFLRRPGLHIRPGGLFQSTLDATNGISNPNQGAIGSPPAKK